MPEYTLKCPRCRKTTKTTRCPNCRAGSKHLFIETYADRTVRGLSCRKCGMTQVAHHCPHCGLEYNPAILKTKGCLGCPTQVLVAAVAIIAVVVLISIL
jgi:hypothetical protein